MKFKFGDSVIVKDGFYKGSTGIIISYELKILEHIEYEIEAHKIDDNNVFREVRCWIDELDLEKVEK